jgi:hypothetical protein
LSPQHSTRFKSGIDTFVIFFASKYANRQLKSDFTADNAHLRRTEDCVPDSENSAEEIKIWQCRPQLT